MKNLISSVIFCILTLFLINVLNEILIPKDENRYYILEKNFIEKNEKYEILVFGSCHSYTSFNPIYVKENYNMSSYVLGNPGEIIPTTYLRMKKTLKQQQPKYAFVEIWGINAYDTYDTIENIFGDYLTTNIERIPLSFEKISALNNFGLDVVENSFPIYKYKDRIINQQLKETDFNYSVEKIKDTYYKTEMKNRLSHNGYRANESIDVSEKYTRNTINENEKMEIEPIIVEYIEKIIQLSKQYNINLIFYRAPYLANKNELKKVRTFEEISKNFDIPFVDLEDEIQFDYKTDFEDVYHLSEIGAKKSTEYLINYIKENNI